MKKQNKKVGKAKGRCSFFFCSFFIVLMGLTGPVFGMEADEREDRPEHCPKLSSISFNPTDSDVRQKESPQELMRRVNRWLAGQAQNFFPKRAAHTGDSKS